MCPVEEQVLAVVWGSLLWALSDLQYFLSPWEVLLWAEPLSGCPQKVTEQCSKVQFQLGIIKRVQLLPWFLAAKASCTL